MSKNIFCGLGKDVPYAHFMNLLDTSFGHESFEKGFISFLPKLYREELRPQDQNYVVTEDGDLAAAVGAYDHQIRVCGRMLNCRGIGNVAVHPSHRSKGYMNLAMEAAMRGMIEDGVAISTLGGRRQRYLYFGYDKAGPVYHYSISRDNMRHALGGMESPFTLREITDPKDEAIDKIIAINDALPFAPVRSREQFLDIANSWNARLLAAYDGERFAGYLVLKDTRVTEIEVVDKADFLSLIRSVYAFLGEGYTVFLLPQQLDYRLALTPIAEGMTLATAMHFNILNYRAVTEAFLALKLTYENLPDGEITLLIHGYARNECIKIAVAGGEASVTAVDESTPVDYELSHAEALSFLFSPISPLRECASDIAKLYFPLPLTMRHADEV
ncbi:MAG: GNAT family N-acetyltransferase [Clostridia bacterium]|nr:GNAT family N-acetyltransferase [Clostridia bacterium]